jgi:hypothetical protein
MEPWRSTTHSRRSMRRSKARSGRAVKSINMSGKSRDCCRDGLAKALGWSVQRDRSAKQRLVIETIKTEIRQHETRISELLARNASAGEFLQSEWIPVIVDGIKKAEQIRSEDRVRTIGQILSNAILCEPLPAGRLCRRDAARRDYSRYHRRRGPASDRREAGTSASGGPARSTKMAPTKPGMRILRKSRAFPTPWLPASAPSLRALGWFAP